MDLKTHAVNNGFFLPEDIYFDGIFHRFANIPSYHARKDEFYKAVEFDGYTQVWYGTFKNGYQCHVWRSWGCDTEIDPEIARKMAEAREAAEAERAEYQQQAALKARELWAGAADAKEHPYLTRKRIQPYHLRVYQDSLIAPIYDPVTDELISIQSIKEDGQKRFFYQASSRGYSCFGNLSQDQAPFVGEGFATCATVHEATGKPVICAYSSAQCAYIANHLINRGLIRSANLLQDTGDAGAKAAKAWIEQGLGEVYECVGEGSNYDFNDLYNDKGLQEVRRQLEPKRIPTIMLSEFLDLDIAKTDWCIENLFVKGSVNTIFASPGVGKSWLAGHLALASVAGWDLLGWQCRQQKVLLVDAELSPPMLRDRQEQMLQTWAMCKRELPEDVDMTLVPWLLVADQCSAWINLHSERGRALMDPLIDSHDFIVLDNWTALTERGDGDDFRSDEKAWEGAYRWMQSWTAKGKTFLLVMHTNKSGGLAGTSRILNRVETALRLDRLSRDVRPRPDNMAFVVNWNKGRGVRDEFKTPFAATLLFPRDIQGHRSPFEMISQEEFKSMEKKVDKGFSPFLDSPF